MIYLLDTCVILWVLQNDRKKIKDFILILENPEAEFLVSVVSYWEIVIKKSLGKLVVPDNITDLIEQTGFSWLNLEVAHIKAIEALPLIHNDPFDRLLIAQA